MVLGMGLVRRNNSKYWYVQFQYQGRVVIRSSGTTDKRLAADVETKIRADLIRCQSLGLKERIKLKDSLDEFLESKTHLASYHHYLAYRKRVLGAMRGEMPVDQILLRDIESYKSKLIKEGLANQTIRHILYFLKAAIKKSKQAGYLVPDWDLPTVKQTPHRLRYLSSDEERQLLESLDPRRPIKGIPEYENRSPIRNQLLHDQYDFVVTLLDTGARHSEIATLEWKSVDLENRFLRLWRPKVRNQSIIYISERLYGVLKRRFDSRDPEITYVFHTRDGRRKSYSANTARRIFDRVGLEDCSYHTLRHTLASKLIQNGLNIYEVKEILGHTDIKTTMRYAHLEVQDVSRKAKAVLDGMRV
jgi:integrase